MYLTAGCWAINNRIDFGLFSIINMFDQLDLYIKIINKLSFYLFLEKMHPSVS